jgi:hypothetical protein
MPVDAATLTELLRLEATIAPDSGSDLSALESTAEVIAWLITCARQDGDDEGDTVELFARHSGATATEVRDIAATLRKLGYVVAADRLKLIAGRRRHDLRPL